MEKFRYWFTRCLTLVLVVYATGCSKSEKCELGEQKKIADKQLLEKISKDVNVNPTNLTAISETKIVGNKAKATAVKTSVATNISPSKVKAVAGTKPKKATIRPETVLVRVNGKNITWRDLSRYTDMMAVLFKNRKKNCTGEDVRRFKAKFMQRFSVDLLHRLVMTTSLASSNIVVRASTKMAVERDFARRYGKKGQKIAALKGELKKAGYLHDIEKALQEEMVIKEFLMTACSNKYNVSAQELKDVRRGMEIRNRVAAATNKLQIAKAKMVLDKIKAGGDFQKLAEEYTEEDRIGSFTDSKDESRSNASSTNDVATVGTKSKIWDLGDCDDSDFASDKHVWQQLQKMKVGEVTGLLEIEEGYAIYKVLAIHNGAESNTGDKSLHLARIFFRRAYEFPEQTDDELRVDVEREKRDELMTSVYKAFKAKSKIEYPDGHIKMH